MKSNTSIIIALFLLGCSSNKKVITSSDVKVDCGVSISRWMDDQTKDSVYSTPKQFKAKGIQKRRSYMELTCNINKETKRTTMSVSIDNFSPLFGMNGVQLFFEDGTKLNKDSDVVLEYYSVLNLYFHIGSFPIDDNDLFRFKNVLITKIKVGQLEVIISKEEGERFKKLADCMMGL